jgi:hypothetical protein
MSRSPSHTGAWSRPSPCSTIFAEGGQPRLEVVDRDDAAAAAVVELIGDLPPRVAAEEDVLAEPVRQLHECDLDRFVELADGLVGVVLRQAVVLGWTFDPQ